MRRIDAIDTSRRGALRPKLVALMIALGTLGGCGGVDSSAENPASTGVSAPSFLLITLDTTRADRLEPYGATSVETPVLQILAADGIVFERAYATTPVTLPSHASIFTGLDPPNHGVRNNGIHHLSEASTTLTEILRQAGYRTAAFVSAAVLEQRYGLAQGFELYDDDLAGGGSKAPRLVAERPAEVTVSSALRWLDETDSGEPFFLWIHLFDPHALYAPPAPFSERYRDRPYEGEIAYLDAQLGRLLAHRRLSGSEDLLVMAIADHGESLGEHGEASHAMLAYDATLHIPWIVRLPSSARVAEAAPLRLSHEVSQVDLLPTALDLLGLGTAAESLNLDGVSQALAIRSRGGEGTAARALYAETLVPYYIYGWARLTSLRRDGWKLIASPSPALYHLPADPGETSNLVTSERERASELGRELGKIGEGSEATATLAVDAAAQAKLRSLGYLPSESSAPHRRERPDPQAMIDLHRAIEQAQDALYRHDFGHAADQLRAVLARDPDNLTALSDLAKASAERGELEEALVLGRRALELAPDSATRRLDLAILLARAGDDEAALAAVDSALAIDALSLDARVEKVRALYRLGRHSEAVALLEGLATEHPDHAAIQIGYAELVSMPAGELAVAEESLRAAVAREPFQTRGWRVLGRLLEDDRPVEALAVYRQALDLLPRDGLLRARLGMLLARRGEAGAEEHLRLAAETLRPPPFEVYSALAAIELQGRAWGAAEGWARRATDLEPADAEGWNHLAIALEEQGRAEEAIAAYRRAVVADPGHWRARFNQGLLLRKLSRFEEAAAMFAEVLGLQPDHAKSHYELGLIYGGSLADPVRARHHLRACLEIDPEHPRAQLVRQLLRELGVAGS